MKNKKFTLIFLLLIILTLVFTSCSSNKNFSSNSSESSKLSDITSEDSAEISIEERFDDRIIANNKVITNVSLSMETKDFINTTDKLKSIINESKSYIEESEVYHNDYIYSTSLKSAHYVIRVPKENLNLFRDKLNSIGNIISENTTQSDITKQYMDKETRLKVLEVKEKRILELLSKAEKMEDIITLENQLNDTIYEKENMVGQLKSMDHDVDYSTFTIHLEEVAKLSPSENRKTPFWTKMGNALEDSFYFFRHNLEQLVITLIYLLPYALIILPIIYVILRTKKKKNLK